MAADEFWLNLRTSASLIAPSVSTDVPGQNADEVERRLREAAIWLTPGTVAGYDPEAFSFLASPERQQLSRAVSDFLDVARQVPGDGPASRPQLRQGWEAFQTLLRLLRPHQFTDFETFKIQYRLERELAGKLPPWVEGLACETGVDVADDPALWIWLNVSQEAVDNDLVIKEGPRVHDEVVRAARRLHTGRWPFVRFRSLAELAAAEKGRRG